MYRPHLKKPSTPNRDSSFSIPEDCPGLQNHRIARTVSDEDVEARREFTDFFNAPRCFAINTNKGSPPGNMSAVNGKFFKAISECITGDEFIFFRFTYVPANAGCTDNAQNWNIEPKNKYKLTPPKPISVRLELMNPERNLEKVQNPVIFVRSATSREPLKEYLTTLATSQEARTKLIARKLTGVMPVSIAHAELLVDAAIDKKILQARINAIEPLIGFWKLPVEVRSRVYELACAAWGQLWPLPEMPQSGRNTILPPPEQGRLFGNWVIHDNGYLEPRRSAEQSSLARFDLARGQYLGFEEVSNGVQRRRMIGTPALLACSRQVRAEVIKVVYVQPEYCFSSIFEFHKFISGLRNDSLESLRKVRVAMPVVDTLILLSLARKCLPVEEAEAIYDLFKMSWPSPRQQLRRQQLRQYLDSAFKENDQTFARAQQMRFTNLTVDPLWEMTALNTSGSRMAQTSGRPDEMSAFSIGESDIHVCRLLLVKLIKWTIDHWETMGVSPPKLHIAWPDSISEGEMAELEALSHEYKQAEIDVSNV